VPTIDLLFPRIDVLDALDVAVRHLRSFAVDFAIVFRATLWMLSLFLPSDKWNVLPVCQVEASFDTGRAWIEPGCRQ
jgi:predicted dithiol-disulfide oxidoreductase (DUF899 family)